jgi:hypothetical protein
MVCGGCRLMKQVTDRNVSKSDNVTTPPPTFVITALRAVLSHVTRNSHQTIEFGNDCPNGDMALSVRRSLWRRDAGKTDPNILINQPSVRSGPDSKYLLRYGPERNRGG